MAVSAAACSASLLFISDQADLRSLKPFKLASKLTLTPEINVLA